ncbi:MAG: Stp1/IreP family PP2C-type Ser/Thr phosphatase [Acidobacteria bacterium]|nr:Stp1/IreP family PP2C-type Ser/Thr phosphatase [Acidobacteriota bacterium]
MTDSTANIITTVAGFTDVGMVRTNNEDNFLIADLATGRVFLIPQRISHKTAENRILLAVSDGVGGASCGEVASSMAVHSMRVELLRRNNTSDPFQRLVQAVEKANTLIWNEGQSNPERRGMGATITAALIEQNTAYIAEVGDSRGYVIHSGRIKQITTDQSLVGILVNRGLMTPEQAETAPGRNIILQSLGCNAEIKVAVSSIELTDGDYLLLCSDGLSGKIKAEELLEYVKNQSSIEECCKQLIELAKERGGEDNITVVLAKFEGQGLRPAEQVTRLTTHIEVLAAFDPEDEAQRKKQKAESKLKTQTKSDDDDIYKTKRLSSEKGKQSSFTNTIGVHSKESKQLSELSTLKIQPDRTSREKLLEQNLATESALINLSNNLRRQIDQFREMVFWAERDGKDATSISETIRKLEQLIKYFENNRLPIDDANKLVDEFSK